MKVLAVSSIGGHWIQLLRLMPAFEGAEVEFMSTKQSFATMVEGRKFHTITDGSRWNKLGLVKCFFNIVTIVRSSKPNVIITTGAAPGLIAIVVGRLFGIKTIWVDSIANCEQVSMSGKIATKVAHIVYTQWKHLEEDNKVKYCGNVLG
jgi:UDP-N-acetylglucosamine:LPS N-acetylglucosamine transferase